MRHLLLVATLLLAAPAFAGCAIVGEPDTDGLYVGAYALQAYEDFDTDSGVDSGDADLGAGIRAGWRFTDRLAIEGFAENVAGFEVESGNVENDLDLLQLGAAAKFYILTGRIQPYLVAGGGAARSDVDDFNLDHDGGFVRGGLGADVYLTSNISVFGEVNYNRMVGGTSDLDHVMAILGLQFMF